MWGAMMGSIHRIRTTFKTFSLNAVRQGPYALRHVSEKFPKVAFEAAPMFVQFTDEGPLSSFS